MAQSPRAHQASTPSPEPAVEGLDGVMAQSKLFTDMASTFGAELLRFASRRMKAQADLLAGLAQCRTVQEMLDQQMEFMRRAGSDYAEEFGTMAQLAQPQKQSEIQEPARGNAD